MSYLPSSRLARRLLKLASLGLAGLLAGLLTGCPASSGDAAGPTVSAAQYTQGEFSQAVPPSGYSSVPLSPTPLEDLYTRRSRSPRRRLAVHRPMYGSFRLSRQPFAMNVPSHS